MGKQRVISPENEQESVKCAIAGGDPIAYLKNCGAKNPSAAWYHIRSKIKDTDPETYEKLPHLYRKKTDVPKATLADAMEGMKDAADEFFGKCEDMGLMKAETPETPRIFKPVVYNDMAVREVEGVFAKYRRVDANNGIYIDVEIPDGVDTLSYTVDQWRNFRAEMDKAALILGVEL